MHYLSAQSNEIEHDVQSPRQWVNRMGENKGCNPR